ncbi:MAG: flavodoxin family protein [Candidatus Aminicenantes bacterium]|nr:flavodoxin family protein [Candidatus Aminicenantes bacterium]
MRFLGINGSYRENGLNEKMLEFLKKEFESKGHSFEIINLREFRIEHCKACVSTDLKSCTPEKCYEIGDDFQKLASKIIDSDGVIFATPSYWYAPSAVMWALIERLTSLENTPVKYLDGKPAAVISAAGEDGAQSAISSIIVPLIHMGMIIIPYGMTYLSGKDDDPETLAYLGRIVKNMIFAASKIPPHCWWENREGTCLSSTIHQES